MPWPPPATALSVCLSWAYLHATLSLTALSALRTFSNLDSALCTHVPPNMPPAYPPSHLAPRRQRARIM